MKGIPCFEIVSWPFPLFSLNPSFCFCGNFMELKNKKKKREKNVAPNVTLLTIEIKVKVPKNFFFLFLFFCPSSYSILIWQLKSPDFQKHLSIFEKCFWVQMKEFYWKFYRMTLTNPSSRICFTKNNDGNDISYSQKELKKEMKRKETNEKDCLLTFYARQFFLILNQMKWNEIKINITRSDIDMNEKMMKPLWANDKTYKWI